MSVRMKVFIKIWKCGCLRVAAKARPIAEHGCNSQNCESVTADGKEYFVAGQELVPVAEESK